MARRLVREEGLFCGGSSGSIVHAAVEVAKEIGPDKTIIVTLCDSGTRYITKFLSDAWMKDHGFLEEGPDLGLVEDLLTARNMSPVTANADTPISEIIHLMREHGVSQIPMIESGKLTSMIHESDIIHGLRDGSISTATPTRDVANPIGGLIYPKARLEELFFLFESDHVAVVVDGGKVVGVVSQIDLIEYLAKNPRPAPLAVAS
jgi:cystathionine beta-synthase